MAAIRAIPERTCVGCFKKDSQDNLLAVTRLKSGQVVVNKNHEISGRSVYLCRNKLCFNKATKRKGKNAFQYGLQIEIPPEVLQELESLV